MMNDVWAQKKKTRVLQYVHFEDFPKYRRKHFCFCRLIMKQLNYSFENKHPMSNIASLFDASKLTKEKKIINDITGLEIFHKRLVNKENKTADFFDDYNFR